MLPEHIIIKKSPRAKRLALRLDPKDRAFHLVMPRGTSMGNAYRFAEENERWMQDALKNLPPPVSFQTGSIIPVLGRRRTMKIICSKTLTSTNVILERNNILVFTNQKNPQAKILRFFKDLAFEELNALTLEKAARLRKVVKNLTVSIRDTKSRWGSCSHTGKICYSWRLILAPPEAMDYVVAHEVAHLKHLDHSDAFWNCCKQLSDNYEEGHYWMHNHGHELMRYGVSNDV